LFFQKLLHFLKWGPFSDERRDVITDGHSPSTGDDSPNDLPHRSLVPSSRYGSSDLLLVLGSTVVLGFGTDDQIFVRSKTIYVFGNWVSSSAKGDGGAINSSQNFLFL
jgi:predicted outer membrane repeat protein